MFDLKRLTDCLLLAGDMQPQISKNDQKRSYTVLVFCFSEKWGKRIRDPENHTGRVIIEEDINEDN